MTAERFSTPSNLGDLPKLTAAEIDDLEARNALKQFDRVMELVRQRVGAGSRLALDPALIKNLNAIAISGLNPDAGEYRCGSITIYGSHHQPPAASDVPGAVEEMCRYYNEHDGVNDAVDLAAYLMWRVNWIHPFSNGNGRTSRAVSYLALSVGLGAELPGTPTVPDQIASRKQPYYEALEAADAAYLAGQVDASLMAQLIWECLKIQVATAVPPPK